MTAKITVSCSAAERELVSGGPLMRPWSIVIESDSQTAVFIANDAAMTTEASSETGVTYKKIAMSPGELVLLRNMLNAMPWP
jgi:hypothetical protein